jgi:hypothetical protein
VSAFRAPGFSAKTRAGGGESIPYCYFQFFSLRWITYFQQQTNTYGHSRPSQLRLRLGRLSRPRYEPAALNAAVPSTAGGFMRLSRPVAAGTNKNFNPCIAGLFRPLALLTRLTHWQFRQTFLENYGENINH